MIYLNNPGRREVSAAVGWLYSGLQVMHPGERPRRTAHSSSALRFIMEGRGAYTIVDGHKMTLGANDFVLTPNGTWHEHGVEADGAPLHLAGRAGHPAGQRDGGRLLRRCTRSCSQAVTHPVDDSVGIWGAAGAAAAERAAGASPTRRCSSTSGSRPTRRCSRLARAQRGQPLRRRADALRQPGRPAATSWPPSAPACSCCARASRGKAHRHTGSFLYQVAKGRGYSVVDGQRFDWQERDIFCVPSWALHEHANASDRGRLPVLLQRPAGDGEARPVPRGGAGGQRRPPAGARG
ncbi:MAG: cupin domain-containing protein [Pseudorhodoferax sp.]